MGERVDWLRALETQDEAEMAEEATATAAAAAAARGGNGNGSQRAAPASAPVDSAVARWQAGAAQNRGAMTKKQKSDMARVRVKYDLPPELKARIEQAAGELVGTSASQFAAWLLTWAMGEFERREDLQGQVLEARRLTRSLRFDWDLELDSPQG